MADFINAYQLTIANEGRYEKTVKRRSPNDS